MGEGGGYTISTLSHIGGDHPPALPIVLGTEQQVHSLVSAGDGGGDLDCLVSDRAGVGGDHTWFTVTAQSTVSPPPTLLKPNRSCPTSAVLRWRELCSDEDVPEVLGAGEGERESLIEGKGEDNTIIGREGNFLAVVIFVN